MSSHASSTHEAYAYLHLSPTSVQQSWQPSTPTSSSAPHGPLPTGAQASGQDGVQQAGANTSSSGAGQPPPNIQNLLTKLEKKYDDLWEMFEARLDATNSTHEGSAEAADEALQGTYEKYTKDFLRDQFGTEDPPKNLFVQVPQLIPLMLRYNVHYLEELLESLDLPDQNALGERGLSLSQYVKEIGNNLQYYRTFLTKVKPSATQQRTSIQRLVGHFAFGLHILAQPKLRDPEEGADVQHSIFSSPLGLCVQRNNVDMVDILSEYCLTESKYSIAKLMTVFQLEYNNIIDADTCSPHSLLSYAVRKGYDKMAASLMKFMCNVFMKKVNEMLNLYRYDPSKQSLEQQQEKKKNIDTAICQVYHTCCKAIPHTYLVRLPNCPTANSTFSDFLATCQPISGTDLPKLSMDDATAFLINHIAQQDLKRVSRPKDALAAWATTVLGELDIYSMKSVLDHFTDAQTPLPPHLERFILTFLAIADKLKVLDACKDLIKAMWTKPFRKPKNQPRPVVMRDFDLLVHEVLVAFCVARVHTWFKTWVALSKKDYAWVNQFKGYIRVKPAGLIFNLLDKNKWNFSKTREGVYDGVTAHHYTPQGGTLQWNRDQLKAASTALSGKCQNILTAFMGSPSSDHEALHLFELRTGGGKSSVVKAAVAHIINNAPEGKHYQVDVITSSSLLARRDAEGIRHDPELKNLKDYEVISLCDTSNVSQQQPSQVKVVVRVGDMAALMFDKLKRPEAPRDVHRICIVDEVDYNLLDCKDRIFRLSTAVPDSFTLAILERFLRETHECFYGKKIDTFTVLPDATNIAHTHSNASVISPTANIIPTSASTTAPTTALTTGSSPSDASTSSSSLSLENQVLAVMLVEKYFTNTGTSTRTKNAKVKTLRTLEVEVQENLESKATLQVPEEDLQGPEDGQQSFKEAPQTHSVEAAQACLLQSFEAARKLKHNVDYVIDGLDVRIIDHTNHSYLPPNVIWNDLVHQIVQLRHGLPLTMPPMYTGEMKVPELIKGYDLVIGLTATPGQGKEYAEYCRDKVEISRYDVTKKQVFVEPWSPVFTPNGPVQDIKDAEPTSRNTNPSVPVADSGDKAKHDYDKAKCDLLNTVAARFSSCVHNKAVMVICKTPKDALEMYDKFVQYNKKYNKFSVVTLFDRDSPDITDTFRAFVALPGQVIIATPIAGRGVHIDPRAVDTPLFASAGYPGAGLDVIVTFTPENERLKRQFEGRTRRLMEKGMFDIFNVDQTSQSSSTAKVTHVVSDDYLVRTHTDWSATAAASDVGKNRSDTSQDPICSSLDKTGQLHPVHPNERVNPDERWYSVEYNTQRVTIKNNINGLEKTITKDGLHLSCALALKPILFAMRNHPYSTRILADLERHLPSGGTSKGPSLFLVLLHSIINHAYDKVIQGIDDLFPTVIRYLYFSRPEDNNDPFSTVLLDARRDWAGIKGCDEILRFAHFPVYINDSILLWMYKCKNPSVPYDYGDLPHVLFDVMRWESKDLVYGTAQVVDGTNPPTPDSGVSIHHKPWKCPQSVTDDKLKHTLEFIQGKVNDTFHDFRSIPTDPKSQPSAASTTPEQILSKYTAVFSRCLVAMCEPKSLEAFIASYHNAFCRSEPYSNPRQDPTKKLLNEYVVLVKKSLFLVRTHVLWLHRHLKKLEKHYSVYDENLSDEIIDIPITLREQPDDSTIWGDSPPPSETTYKLIEENKDIIANLSSTFRKHYTPEKTARQDGYVHRNIELSTLRKSNIDFGTYYQSPPPTTGSGAAQRSITFKIRDLDPAIDILESTPGPESGFSYLYNPPVSAQTTSPQANGGTHASG